MFTIQTTPPAEHLHSKRCLASALIAAVENMRDAADGDLTFRLQAQQNDALSWADEYLTSGTITCICPATPGQRRLLTRLGHHMTAGDETLTWPQAAAVIASEMAAQA